MLFLALKKQDFIQIFVVEKQCFVSRDPQLEPELELEQESEPEPKLF
jgi:hypothetical protein